MTDDPRRSLTVRPMGGSVTGAVTVPGDKSISHRAAILATLSGSRHHLHGFLDAADTRATLAALQALGVPLEQTGTSVTVDGVGLDGLNQPEAELDLGNSGTGLRLLAGVLAGQDLRAVLTGDASLRSRPMERVAEPLRRMGAEVTTSGGGTAPVTVRGRPPLSGMDHALPVASAQIKSAILLAGLNADDPVTVTSPGPSRDHTERMLSAAGVAIRTEGYRVSMDPPGRLRLPDVLTVPADLSSAAFFLVLASMLPDARIQMTGIGVNPTRDGVLRILDRMGADIRRSDGADAGGESVADLEVTSAELTGVDVSPEEVAMAIDEIPVLAIAAACARGRTTFRGAGELRAKESDRIAAMVAGLTALGIRAEETEDGFTLEGGSIRGGEVDARGDHRIAMAFAVAGTVASDPVGITDTANIDTSFPGFVSCLTGLGVDVTEGQG